MNLYEMQQLMSYEGTRIVTVGLVSGGYILTGKRRDNGLWTSPGGHVDDGEGILSAAIREVKEESGIDVCNEQLEFIHAEKVISHRTGKPFVVIALLAHVDKEKATAKNDPDQEVSEWRWVEISKSSPELQRDCRHAKDDFVLIHLGLLTKETQMGFRDKKTRKMSEVTKDLQNANLEEAPPEKEPAPAPAQPKLPDPKEKTPEEMVTHPDADVEEDEVTGD